MKYFKKIVVLFLCIFCAAGTVFADNFIKTGSKLLTVPKDSHKYVQADFYEGSKLVRFEATKISNGRQTEIRCTTGKKIFGVVDTGNTLWSVTDNLDGRSYMAYELKQYRSINTGHYYYSIDCMYARKSSYRSYLIGYDTDYKKMHQYINSRNFTQPKYGNPRIDVSNNKLYLNCTPANSKTRTLYLLDWSAADNWFSYETQPEI
jgi:hypothetical protein